jgi:hypothetical protein
MAAAKRPGRCPDRHGGRPTDARGGAPVSDLTLMRTIAQFDTFDVRLVTAYCRAEEEEVITFLRARPAARQETLGAAVLWRPPVSVGCAQVRRVLDPPCVASASGRQADANTMTLLR